ncbi:type VI secretion system lipoprotein TssJ [Citrobacter werkmanii]|uniref:type VI secretion system lipoprotein TssJ n=1 Tax=Citrobacter werkmanii TaxID=67827 RepID=UPI002655A761|nr:type VI secretion system lipoprotein TssJ [Citrobacter werkmanii]MDN8559117.1 type VI secretion system lipoprotein TssJ [Citrobacter werkmanii]
MLRTTLIKQASVLLLSLLAAGCGLTQKVSDGTSSAVTSLFYKQVKTLHLDITAREALNTSTQENTSLSEPVMVRVYQLKDSKSFDKMVYQQLVTEGDAAPEAGVLTVRNLVVKPGEDAGLDMPLEESAQFVAIVGLFRQPDQTKNDWKIILARDDLDPDKPRVIEAGNNRLTLQPPEDD